MRDLFISASHETPQIDFEYSRHRLGLYGASYPEDASRFYDPVRSSLETYLTALDPGARLVVTIGLYYVDRSSARLIRSLFDLFAMAAMNGPAISVKWLFDEDDDMMFEFGLDLGERYPPLNIEAVAVVSR